MEVLGKAKNKTQLTKKQREKYLLLVAEIMYKQVAKHKNPKQ